MIEVGATPPVGGVAPFVALIEVAFSVVFLYSIRAMASPYHYLKFWLLPLLRSRIRVEGLDHLPPDGRYIVTPNHRSWMDSAIIGGALYKNIPQTLRFIAQTRKYPWAGTIAIDKNDKGAVLASAARDLEAGHPVVIFPEGNSHRIPGMRRGKTGAVRLQGMTGAPIIPVGIDGSEGVSILAAVAWFFAFWKPCRVRIGQPMMLAPLPADVTHDELHDRTDVVIAAIEKLIDPTRVTHRSLMAGLLQTMQTILRFRVHVRGTEHLPENGAFIIAGNHESYFDPGAVKIALWVNRKRNVFFLTKAAIAKTWKMLLGPGAWNLLGMLPIDVTDKSKVLESAIAHLRAGGVVGIFPEGTRNKPSLNPDWEHTFLKAKTGVARLAYATGAPIIPVAITAPKGIGILQTIANILRFWKPTKIEFLPAITTTPHSDAAKEELERLTTLVMTTIASARGKRYPV